MTRLLLPALVGFGLVVSATAVQGQPRRYYYPSVSPCYPPVIYVPIYLPPGLAWPQQPAYPPPKVRQESSVPNAASSELARPEAARPDSTKPETKPAPTPPPGSRDGPGDIKPAAFDIKRPTPEKPEGLDIPKPTPPVPEKPAFDPDRIPLVAPPRPVDPNVTAPPTIPPPNLPAKPDSGLPAIPLLPAPEKPKENDPKLPSLRGVPDPSLPGLSLPVPGTDPAKSTSKFSPLPSRPRPLIDLIPVAGAAPVDPAARRRVGFFNHTDRDLRLVVEGQSITLPRRHQITASVPPTFDWQLDEGERQMTTIPAAAPGLEVVIRR